MVERLKIAVEKARAERDRAGKSQPAKKAGESPGSTIANRSSRVAGKAGAAPLMLGSMETPQIATEDALATTAMTGVAIPADLEVRRGAAWNALEPLELSAKHLERNRIISFGKMDPVHVAFDVLRTRMLTSLTRKGWTRVGITSPTAACGKTFVAANLAISLSRQAQCRTALIDLDMQKPGLARTLGVKKQDQLRWFLEGEIPASKFLRRVGANLALGLNSTRLRDANELIQAPSTAHALTTMQAQFAPNVIIYDLPPMLAGDDVTGFLPNLDCMLLIVGGGISKPAEVSECERLLEDHCPLLGVLLNKGDGVNVSHYAYE